jgi:hypothetical protein
LGNGREHDSREKRCGKHQAKYGQARRKHDHAKHSFLVTMTSLSYDCSFG